jgi:hypothetical protein
MRSSLTVNSLEGVFMKISLKSNRIKSINIFAFSLFLALGVFTNGKLANAQDFPCGSPGFGGVGTFETFFWSTSPSEIATQDCDNIPGLLPVKKGDVLSLDAEAGQISLSKEVADGMGTKSSFYLDLRVPTDGNYTCSTPGQVNAENFSGNLVEINADNVAGTFTIQSKHDKTATCTFNQCPGFGACSLTN